MQIRKLHEQQGIKHAMKQTSADSRITALKEKLKVSSQPKRVISKRLRERFAKNQHRGETEGILQ